MAVAVLLGLLIPKQVISNQSEAQVIPPVEESLADTADKETIIKAIREIAIKYGVDESSLMLTIQCESGFRHAGIFGDWNGEKHLAYGLAQYHQPTFYRFCEGSYYSAQDQLECMAQMFANGHQRHWSCYRKLNF